MALTLFSWCLSFPKHLPPKIPFAATEIAVFAILAAFSLAINAFRLERLEIFIALLYLLRWLAYAGLYFYAVSADFFSPRQLIEFLAGIGFMSAVFGLIQYLLWPDLRASTVFNWDPHYFRIVGTFLDPGYTALIFVFTLILFWQIGSCFQTTVRQKKLLWFLGIVVYLALALTYSRSGYVAFLIAAAFFAWYQKKPKVFFIALLVLTVTVFILPRPEGEGVRLERTASSLARIINWGQTIRVFSHHPLFGVGFNAYRYAQRDFGFLDAGWQQNHAGAGGDSSLLFVLATTGLFGGIAYLCLWGKVFWRHFHHPKSAALAATLVSLWGHSFFLNRQFYPWVLAWIWLLLAVMETSWPKLKNR